MSDLTATQCGCDHHNSGSSNGCCGIFIWIILLSCLCGGNGNTFSGNFGNGCSSDDGNGCNLIIWIILLSCLCGNGSNNCFF